MIESLALFASSFLYVALKAGQQRNVAFDHYWMVPPFSMGMAATEVYIISHVAVKGFSMAAVLGMGVGGAAGAIVAMMLHKRYLGVKL